MRHGKKFNHLGRKPAHRHATLSNMATSLILKKRISTTVAKAKALRKYVEPIITRSKDDTTHSRRMVFKYLQSKECVKELFSEVADKVASRPGGYTRIIKTGYRLGDNAEMCMMELVDFNELLLQESQAGKSKTRRGRSKKSTGAEDAKIVSDATVSEPTTEQLEETVSQPIDETIVEDVVAEKVVVAEEPVIEDLATTDIVDEAEVAEVVAESEATVANELPDDVSEADAEAHVDDEAPLSDDEEEDKKKD
ncbi:MAG: 50S ribosomal protein L17 [Bacteroidetes bacterium]|nr:50S ribosomal protein L17 [Bacteroidota bacterium]MDA1119476.1 50S ribosomal protein L17 [Bacteroidota bacterium]